MSLGGDPSMHGIQKDDVLSGVKATASSALCSASSVPESFSFWKWCSGLVISILRTRSPFAAFLLSTLHLPPSSQTSTSPLFPLPIPEEGIFRRMPEHCSLRQRRRCHLKRVLRVMVMALNYWHGGLGTFPNKQLLQRCPSKVHRTIYHKLMGILVADGSGTSSFEVLKSGRRFPQLSARLGELSDCLTKLGVAGPYSFMFIGHSVPLDNDKLPEHTPYRNLDASRLKLSGDGSFDASAFLDIVCPARTRTRTRTETVILIDELNPERIYGRNRTRIRTRSRTRSRTGTVIEVNPVDESKESNSKIAVVDSNSNSNSNSNCFPPPGVKLSSIGIRTRTRTGSPPGV